MSFNRFLQESKKGFPSPVYLLTYSDEFFASQAVRNIRDSLSRDFMDFNLDVYDVEDRDQPFSIPAVIDTLNTVSLFAKKRFIVVKNVNKLKKKDIDLFKRYVKKPADQSLLFLFYSGSLKKTFDLEGAKILKLELKKSEIPKWIEKVASKKEVVLTPEVVKHLSELLSDNMSVIYNEIEKLSLLGKPKIGIGELNESFYGSKELSPFQLTKALTTKDKVKTLKIYGELRKRTDALMLMGAINWQLSRLKINDDVSLKIYSEMMAMDRRLKSTNTGLTLEHLFLRIIENLGGKR